MCEKDRVIDILLKTGRTVAAAESCTGGMVAKAFTDYPGVSAVFLEGIVTYANEAKIRMCVKPETIEAHGAVSHETAREMAEAVQKRAGADVAVSTTGIAGPGGGTARKPVGLVYVGIRTEKGTKTYTLRLSGNRATVRQKTVNAVFHFLLNALEEL
ncbi:MAG: nicotinamide-nucleotide amidohydrolase family protein [Ruminococcaceae bacterium]|nr:nicotinamide-nucleotide amidohydrolase family protein [Oscillospiraceae bacterium]